MASVLVRPSDFRVMAMVAFPHTDRQLFPTLAFLRNPDGQTDILAPSVLYRVTDRCARTHTHSYTTLRADPPQETTCVCAEAEQECVSREGQADGKRTSLSKVIGRVPCSVV